MITNELKVGVLLVILGIISLYICAIIPYKYDGYFALIPFGFLMLGVPMTIMEVSE